MPRKPSKRLGFSFTALPTHLTKSESFLACKPQAKVIWFMLMERYNGENNGLISLSVREAASYVGCSPNSAGKHINQLLEVGLVERTMKTGFTCGKRLASTYSLTHLPCKGRPASNLWKKFQP